MQKTFLLPVHQIVSETPDASTFHFFQPAVDRIWYRPGQYVTIRVEIDAQFHYRSYSLSTVAGQEDTLGFTVKRVSGGLVSNYLLDHIKEGDKLELSRPLGRFGVETSIKEKRQLILFGAGSGITPLFSILKATLFQEPLSRIDLFYANRTEEQVIFSDTLEELQAKFADRFRIQHIRSLPSPSSGSHIWQERTHPDLIRRYLAQTVQSNFPQSYYLCGPTQWMEMVYETLLEADIQPSQIFRESFVMEEREQKNNFPSEGPTRTVKVQWGELEHVIEVTAGTTILDAARIQGIELPYSCKSGTCATCMGRLLAGKVSMENNEALLDFEVEQGKVLVCQAHPESEQVTIQIGW